MSYLNVMEKKVTKTSRNIVCLVEFMNCIAIICFITTICAEEIETKYRRNRTHARLFNWLLEYSPCLAEETRIRHSAHSPHHGL